MALRGLIFFMCYFRFGCVEFLHHSFFKRICICRRGGLDPYLIGRHLCGALIGNEDLRNCYSYVLSMTRIREAYFLSAR